MQQGGGGFFKFIKKRMPDFFFKNLFLQVAILIITQKKQCFKTHSYLTVNVSVLDLLAQTK